MREGHRTWTSRETKYLVKNYETKSRSEIAKHLNRTVDSIKVKAKTLGLKQDRSITCSKYKVNHNFSVGRML